MAYLSSRLVPKFFLSAYRDGSGVARLVLGSEFVSSEKKETVLGISPAVVGCTETIGDVETGDRIDMEERVERKSDVCFRCKHLHTTTQLPPCDQPNFTSQARFPNFRRGS